MRPKLWKSHIVHNIAGDEVGKGRIIMSKIDGGMPGFFVSIYLQTPFKKGENIHTVSWTYLQQFPLF